MFPLFPLRVSLADRFPFPREQGENVPFRGDDRFAVSQVF